MADRGDAASVARPERGEARARDAGASAPEAAPVEPLRQAAAEADAAEPAERGAAEGDAGGAAPSAKAAVVAGEYQGWDLTTYRMPNVPESPQRDPNARIRVSRGQGDVIDVTIINSANGQDLCMLKGKLKGSTATFDKGQRCFDEGNNMMTATLRQGSARFSGKQMIVDAEFDLEIDTGQNQMSGDIVYHFEGDRK